MMNNLFQYLTEWEFNENEQMNFIDVKKHIKSV